MCQSGRDTDDGEKCHIKMEEVEDKKKKAAVRMLNSLACSRSLQKVILQELSRNSKINHRGQATAPKGANTGISSIGYTQWLIRLVIQIEI